MCKWSEPCLTKMCDFKYNSNETIDDICLYGISDDVGFARL